MQLYREFTTQEAVDREYNIELAVGDMRPYIDWFVNGSASARRDLECVLDVRYGPTLDLFPARQPGAPVLLFIHGGYWRLLSSKEFSLVARGLVQRDVTVAVMNYSLCPKVTIAEITRQSRAAVAWLTRHAAEYHADAGRLYVCGHSAGGHQVGMLAVTDWPGDYGLPADVIKGGIPISGLFDLRPFRYSWLQPKLLLTHELILQQSPLDLIPAGGPPLLVTLGGDESAEFHRQSRDFVSAWRARGLVAETFDQPGCNHLNAIAGFEDPASALCQAVVDFMARW